MFEPWAHYLVTPRVQMQAYSASSQEGGVSEVQSHHSWDTQTLPQLINWNNNRQVIGTGNSSL